MCSNCEYGILMVMTLLHRQLYLTLYDLLTQYTFYKIHLIYCFLFMRFVKNMV